MYQEYFTEEHQIFRASVRKFVEREIKPHIDRWEDEELFPIELYGKMADAGLLGIGYPEAYGGVPCDKFMHIAFTEEMIRSGSVGLVSGLGSHSIAMPPVLNLGTEEQKQRFLVPVLAGKKIAALGITEPNAGSDVANIRTRAVREGDHYVVNGAKTFITSGCRANFITTAVRTGGPGYKGVSLLMIDSAAPGFSATHASFSKVARAPRWSPATVTMRHGASLPWSGVRAAIAAISRSWSGVGPGATISRGLPERRVRRRLSGVERSLKVMDGS